MAMSGAQNGLPPAERTSASRPASGPGSYLPAAGGGGRVEPRRWWRRWWLPPLAAFLAFLTVPGWYHLKYRQRRNAILALSTIARQDLDLGEPAPRPWPFSLFGGEPSWTRRPVREIDLTATEADDAVLAHFGRIGDLPDTLWGLKLSGTRITDAGLVHARELTQLQDLRLSHTQVTDAGLAHLRTMLLLRELYLRGTLVTDEGLVHLKGMPCLECVEVSKTRVTEEGAKSLKMSLRSGAGVHR